MARLVFTGLFSAALFLLLMGLQALTGLKVLLFLATPGILIEPLYSVFSAGEIPNSLLFITTLGYYFLLGILAALFTKRSWLVLVILIILVGLTLVGSILALLVLFSGDSRVSW